MVMPRRELYLGLGATGGESFLWLRCHAFRTAFKRVAAAPSPFQEAVYSTIETGAFSGAVPILST